MKSLPPPDDAINNDSAVEVLRGWVVDGSLHVSLAFEAFGNYPEIWGQLLAETVTHLADAMHAESYGERDVILERIRASLLEHLENPSLGLTGTVHSRKQ